MKAWQIRIIDLEAEDVPEDGLCIAFTPDGALPFGEGTVEHFDRALSQLVLEALDAGLQGRLRTAVGEAMQMLRQYGKHRPPPLGSLWRQNRGAFAFAAWKVIGFDCGADSGVELASGERRAEVTWHDFEFHWQEA